MMISGNVPMFSNEEKISVSCYFVYFTFINCLEKFIFLPSIKTIPFFAKRKRISAPEQNSRY